MVRADDTPKLKRGISTDSVEFVRVFSDDSKLGSFLFSNLLAATEIGRASLPTKLDADAVDWAQVDS